MFWLPRTQLMGSCLSFPGLSCWAVVLASGDSSVWQLFKLPGTQVLDSCFSFPGLKCLAVDLAS